MTCVRMMIQSCLHILGGIKFAWCWVTRPCTPTAYRLHTFKNVIYLKDLLSSVSQRIPRFLLYIASDTILLTAVSSQQLSRVSTKKTNTGSKLQYCCTSLTQLTKELIQVLWHWTQNVWPENHFSRNLSTMWIIGILQINIGTHWRQ